MPKTREFVKESMKLGRNGERGEAKRHLTLICLLYVISEAGVEDI